MFFCDLINLFNITFFFDSFMDKEEKHGLIGFLMTNKVPMSFIVTFLLQFGMMVVDRWIYKGKRRFIKTLFHFFQVFTYHIWFFIIYPMVTLRVFSETPAVQTFYVTKCMYFLFSAYQIRNGYPMLISMHFLWHRYTTFNRFAFKFYTLIPYVFELRTLLDWTITDTCLGVSQYFKMEDITENIYDQMCEREFEKLTSSEESSGKRKKRPLKYALGCVLFVLLTFSLILPFLIFAMSGTVGVTTHPPRMRLSLYLGTMQPIYVCVSDALSMTVMSHDDFKNISRTFNNIQTSKDIFDKYEPEDVVVVKWTSYSSENWDISPKGYTSLIDQVKTFDSFTARLVIEYVHESNSEECGKEEKIFEQTSAPFVALQREALVNMMMTETATEPLWIPLIFPKFISIDKDGIPEAFRLWNPCGGENDKA
ncbi:piezo-type mechanosensitive ion channel component-like [Sitophilus oryzae]|uniref:Piezo-type mechanosensitive ion channel component-like n=1 Tax=Sitophilus oryzae TaxID=7048 RepID=A0A6J2Y580_SITOR|nr:piezo-type mechanosensitive ion channel component-like [Sitophilus oryzae]